MSLTKDPSGNIVTAVFSVKPALPVLATFDFATILSVDLPAKIACSYSSGVLTVTITYNQTVQGLVASLSIVPPSTSTTFEMKTSRVAFVVEPSNGAAYYLPKSSYRVSKNYSDLLVGLLAIALLTVVISLPFWKLQGLESAYLLQLLFVAVCAMGKVHPYLEGARVLTGASGYNGMLAAVVNQTSSDTVLAQLGVGPWFLQNYN